MKEDIIELQQLVDDLGIEGVAVYEVNVAPYDNRIAVNWNGDERTYKTVTGARRALKAAAKGF